MPEGGHDQDDVISVDGMPADAWVTDAARVLHRHRCADWRVSLAETSAAHQSSDRRVAERILRDSVGWVIAELSSRAIDNDQ